MNELRKLPDLELAALLSALHEGTLGMLTLQAPGSSELLAAAAHALGREILARRAGSASEDRLFSSGVQLPANEAPELESLLLHLEGRLQQAGFLAAAVTLRARAIEEIEVMGGLDGAAPPLKLAKAEQRPLH